MKPTPPSPTELNYFFEVAHHLNFSRAAERLGITQPTLSVAVQRLEDSVGNPLFIRSRTGVQLTRAGQVLFRKGKTLSEAWEQLLHEINDTESEISGIYTLGCHPSVALSTLPSLLPDLLETFPKLELNLRHDVSRRITEDVVSFRIDFGIVVNPIQHPDLVIRNLWHDVVGLWTSNTGRDLQKIESGDAILIFDPDIPGSQAILKKLQTDDIKFSRYITTPNLEVVASLVASGAGIGILPSGVALRPGLKLRQIKGPKIEDSHTLVFRSDAQRSKASLELARWLEKGLKTKVKNALSPS